MARRKKQLRYNVLDQVIKDVSAREKVYGDPLENHVKIAVLMDAWRSICPLDNDEKHLPFDSIVFQILTNLARLSCTPEHKGSWENIAGYAAIGAEVTNV